MRIGQVLKLTPSDIVFGDLPKHWGITGIWEPLITCVYDEGEKSAEKGKAESFGGLLESLSEVAQEGENLL